jgi:hypothetical protein
VERPRAQDRSHLCQHLFKVLGLLLEDRANVLTRARSGAAERNDPLDLGKRQPEMARPPDEGKQSEHIGR